MMATIFLSAEGMVDSAARRFFPEVSDEAFASASIDLVVGEWVMRRGRVYFTLAGLRRLARIFGADLKFEGIEGVLAGRECLPPRDRD